MVLKILFANRENRHVGPFIEFLKESQAQGHVKSLNKDQWDVFYEFSRTMDDKFTGYSDTAAWPSLFDEYVEWCQKQVRNLSPSELTVELRSFRRCRYLWIVVGCICMANPRFIALIHRQCKVSQDGYNSGVLHS